MMIYQIMMTTLLLILLINPSQSEEKFILNGSGNQIEEINIGDKIANISSMNGNIEISSVSGHGGRYIEKINHIDFSKYNGFSEFFYNKNNDAYYLVEHDHESPTLREVIIEDKYYNNISIETMKGNINNTQTIIVDGNYANGDYVNGDYVNGNKITYNGSPEFNYAPSYYFPQENNNTYSLELQIKK